MNGKPMNLYAGDNYHFTYDLVVTPLPATLELPSVWRNQGDLEYTYLFGATDDMLVINGDDGRFSGMHDDSSVYAIHRQTGKKLWQIDAGYGRLSMIMGNADDSITVYTSFNPEKKVYEDRVRQIRLADGEVLWESKPKGGGEGRFTELRGAKDSVIIYDRPGLNERSGNLVVLDRTTGEQKWKRKITGDFRVLNSRADEPYVLIQEGKLLQARDTNTGRVAWSLKADVATGQDPQLYPFYAGGPRIDPFARDQSLRSWLFHGDQWLLVDLGTGQEIARYPAKAGERFEVLNEQYLLIQRLLPADSAKSRTESYESVLYDTAAGRELWTMQGKASKGVIEGEDLYFVIEGVPIKAELKTGRVIWKVPVHISRDLDLSYLAPGSYVVLGDYLLFPYGYDLLVFGKKDGHMVGRIQDVRMGYADLREQMARNGVLNVAGDELYAGSANGAFTRLSVKELERRLKGLER
ncbi:outer membrane biogenesis protein BamB [compost metagenome]